MPVASPPVVVPAVAPSGRRTRGRPPPVVVPAAPVVVPPAPAAAAAVASVASVAAAVASAAALPVLLEVAMDTESFFPLSSYPS